MSRLSSHDVELTCYKRASPWIGRGKFRYVKAVDAYSML